MIRIDVTEISREEAHSETGIGYWGVKLGPNQTIAYECPMLGDGGDALNTQEVLAWLLASYVRSDELDPDEGPDEVLFAHGGNYYLATISVE
jgi:hypothetical protein